MRYYKLPIFILMISFISLPALAEESLTELTDKPLAKAFELMDMDGNKVKLSDFLGKPVIINFWATWCPPCRAELPSMNRAWTKVKDKGVAMLAINVGEDEETIFSFMADYPIEFKVLLDQTGDIVSQWPIKGLPTTFVLDPQGRLFYRAIGGREWDSEELIKQVLALKK